MSEEPFRLIIMDSITANLRVDFTGRGANHLSVPLRCVHQVGADVLHSMSASAWKSVVACLTGELAERQQKLGYIMSRLRKVHAKPLDTYTIQAASAATVHVLNILTPAPRMPGAALGGVQRGSPNNEPCSEHHVPALDPSCSAACHSSCAIHCHHAIDSMYQLAKGCSSTPLTVPLCAISLLSFPQVSDPSGGAMFVADPKKPVGGHVLAHASTIRISLRKGKGEQRLMKVVDAPNLREAHHPLA